MAVTATACAIQCLDSFRDDHDQGRSDKDSRAECRDEAELARGQGEGEGEDAGEEGAGIRLELR